jgi:hypothetical protein
MKNIIAAGIIAIAIVIAAFSSGHAQAATAIPPFPLIEEVQTVSQCFLHGGDSVICIATDGIEFSYLGAAFVKPVTGGTGPAGPQGPVGPAGATGPQGPAGSGGVSSVNGKTGAVVLNATIQ